MSQAREPNCRIPLLVGLAHSSPPIRYTKFDVVLAVVFGVDNLRIRGLLVKVLERTLIWIGRLSIDLDLVATQERGNPVLRAGLQWLATLDADVGACVVDRKLAGGHSFGVVPTKVRPLEDVCTIGNPVRNLEGGTLALVCVATVKSLPVALASIALALND